MTGLLRQWQALESWAAAGKLGVLRALVRDDDQPLAGGGYRGDLPEGWTNSLPRGGPRPVDAGGVGGAADVGVVEPSWILPGAGDGLPPANSPWRKRGQLTPR